MKRSAIAIVLVLGLAAVGCKKKGGDEPSTGSGSVAAPSGPVGSAVVGSGSDTGSAVAGSAAVNSIPDCRALIAAVDKIATCDKIDPSKAQFIHQTADLLRQMLPEIVRSGDAKRIAKAANECKTNLEAMKASGCPL
jgi:hypothetical protein